MLSGKILRDAIISGANNIINNKESVDELNVFPVPDGDTGTNMSMTIRNAVAELNMLSDSATVETVAQTAASAMLRGARGNSGVILSLLFRGLSKGLAGKHEATVEDYCNALKLGAEAAYKSVMKPTEGTILTVARVAAEKANDAQCKDFAELFDVLTTAAKETLDQTPEMLPVLKQAKVVDAGGSGFVAMLKGMLASLKGQDIAAADTEPDAGQSHSGAADFSEIEPASIKFAYCTECIVAKSPEHVGDGTGEPFKKAIEPLGDSMVFVDDESIIKVHIHTNDPGKAIQYACELGELVNLKIDNMAEERRERLQKAEAAQKAAEEKKRQEEAEKAEQPLKEYGMVAVSLGEGFSGIFGDLGVDHIVEGGQTMNPSIEDILDAVEKVGAKNVFVLPNNSNVILAASQAAELSERNVVVLPTKNVAMGIGAVIAFNPEASVEENREAMTAAAEQVKTGQITFAVRDTVFEDKEIKEGDIIGIHNGRIEVVGKSIHDIALELVKHVVEDGDSLITIYYGQDTKQEDADALGAEVAEMFSDLDVEVQYGGQPLYYYLISAE